jgi:hypothetical protein
MMLWLPDGAKMKPPNKERTTIVSLSIKKVPAQLVERLRRRAAANHLSLQGELLSVLEEAIGAKHATISEVREKLSKLGLRTPKKAPQ